MKSPPPLPDLHLWQEKKPQGKYIVLYVLWICLSSVVKPDSSVHFGAFLSPNVPSASKTEHPQLVSSPCINVPSPTIRIQSNNVKLNLFSFEATWGGDVIVTACVHCWSSIKNTTFMSTFERKFSSQCFCFDYAWVWGLVLKICVRIFLFHRVKTTSDVLIPDSVSWVQCFSQFARKNTIGSKAHERDFSLGPLHAFTDLLHVSFRRVSTQNKAMICLGSQYGAPLERIFFAVGPTLRRMQGYCCAVFFFALRIIRWGE